MNEFDLQFKIFTLVDKSYFILNGSITLTLSVCLIYRFDAIRILRSVFQRSNRQTCLYTLRDRIQKKSQKTNIKRLGNKIKVFNGYKRKITI